MNPVSVLLLGLIRAYQLSLRGVIGPQCRFEPSCSHYAQQAIRIHGAYRGSRLGASRLLRCHPWNEGGFDPVPDPAGCACQPHHRLRTDP